MDAPARTAPIAIALIAATALGLYFALSPRTEAEPMDDVAPPAHSAAPDRPTPPPTAATVAVEPTPAPPAPAPLRFPDGSTSPPLNGVTAPAPLTWGPHPWSPIVGTTWSEGVEWYVHEDGTRTTTLDLWRTDLGRYDAVTVVVHSGEPSPIDQLGEMGAIRGRRK